MSAHAARPLFDDSFTAGGVRESAADKAEQERRIEEQRVRQLSQALREMDEALGIEREAVKQDPRHGSIPVGCGRVVSRDSQQTEYEVMTQKPVVGLCVGQDVGYEISDVVYPAVIVAIRPAAVRLSVAVDLGDITAPGSILRDTLWLLDALRTSLREILADIV